MNFRGRLLSSLIVISILTSCISIAEVRPTSIPLPTNTAAPIITPLPTERTEPEQAVEHPNNTISYNITAEMKYDAKTILVEEEINFTNGTGIKLEDILLVVPPNAIPGTFELIQVFVNKSNHDGFELDGERLLIKGLALPNSDQIQLGVRFKLTLPEITQGDPKIERPKIFGVTDQQVNLTDWYAMVVPYDAKEGWLLHNAGFYGEHLVYPVSNINLKFIFTETENIPTIASSTQPEMVDATYTYSFPNSRDFVLSMGRTMQVASGDADGIAVHSYYFMPYKTGGEAVLKTTIESIQLYTKLFGPIDRRSVSAVQGDFDDGMEFDGLYYLSESFYNLYDGNPNQYLILVAAHETCHQWWFASVANDQAIHPWMDESLSTYCEKLYYENYYPELVDWWWFTRINFYEPSGFIDQDIFTYQGFTPYTNATYRQGAKFLEELRVLIGDEAFFAFLRQYASEMGGKIATPEDFFRILRANTNADLTSLISNYFQGSY
jgi:hypothetical protein